MSSVPHRRGSADARDGRHGDAAAPCAPRPRRRAVLAGAAPVVAALLSGCGEDETPPAVPTGPAAASPSPQASTEQVAQIVADVSARVVAADGARDPSLLAPRVVGTALEMRTRAYENLGKVPGLPATLPTPSSDLQTALVPSGEGFPHTVIAVVTDSADAAVHHFLPLQLADARSVYTTWGWARQLGGVTMPAGVAPRLGAAAVDAADDEDLVLAPQDALALFAAVLSNGDAADPSDLLEPDTFTEEMHASIQAERTMLNPDVPADSLATIHEEYTVHPGELAALRTADGGAFVAGSLRSSRVITLVGGATMSSPDPELALAGTSGAFTQEAVREYGATVVLYVPPSGKSGRIRALAAVKSLLGASGQ